MEVWEDWQGKETMVNAQQDQSRLMGAWALTAMEEMGEEGSCVVTRSWMVKGLGDWWRGPHEGRYCWGREEVQSQGTDRLDWQVQRGRRG